MVNYCLQLFLPHPERQQVGIDEQFEFIAEQAVALGRARGYCSGSIRVVFSRVAAESSGHYGTAWSHPQLDLDERQD
jgi:hypothetical protein